MSASGPSLVQTYYIPAGFIAARRSATVMLLWTRKCHNIDDDQERFYYILRP